MSVLACSRNDCPNVMCDNQINYEYYICNECLAELKEKYGDKVKLSIIKDFLDTEKNCDSIIDLNDVRIHNDFL